MVDKKDLLSEIALLTNLLGKEPHGIKTNLQRNEKNYSQIYPKRQTILRPETLNSRFSSNLEGLRPLSPAAVLALVESGNNNSGKNSNITKNSAEVKKVSNAHSQRYKWVSHSGSVSKSESVSVPLVSKISNYKVDRRERKSSKNSSPATSSNLVRKNSGSSNLSSLLSLTNHRNDLVVPSRKYSIKKYSIRKLKSNPNASQGKPETRKVSNANSYLARREKGSRQVLRIDGAKYLSVNAGRSLKRIRTSSATLSNFQNVDKPMSQSHRMANRVLQKSINTLAGEKRKNRVCYFLRNFGYCRRKHTTCPFFHGLSTIPTDKIPANVQKCHYFKTGKCFRPTCPYLHDPNDPRAIRLKAAWKQQRQRIKFLATRSTFSFKRQQQKQLANLPEETAGPTARYFRAEPDANPVSSIITRRLPKGVELDPEEVNVSKKSIEAVEKAISSEDCDIKLLEANKVQTQRVSPAKCNSSLQTDQKDILEPAVTEDPRRQRLMSKLVNLKKRVGKDMPAFLRF